MCCSIMVYAHRSGCHSLHSCPSDSNTYICGDTGYCNFCPDNQYCFNGNPRVGEPPTDIGADGGSSGVDFSGDISGEYNRGDYHTGWVDVDNDCQDARQEVLIAESIDPVLLDANRCRVLSGRWYDTYTGQYFDDPSGLDIDHVVPLAEAHTSGASEWPSDRKSAYAQDISSPDTLITVSASANRSKGSKDPARWMPPNTEYHCEYLRIWVEIKNRWDLGFDPVELASIKQQQQEKCTETN